MMTSPYVCQSNLTSVHRTDSMTSPSVCQSRQSSVRRTVELTHPSVCQQKYMPVCHTINTTSPSICQAHDTSVRHAMITKSPSVCPSKESSDHHTTLWTSPSLCQSRDSSVCYPTRDVRHAVCSSSVTSVLSSANTMVKIPTSIPVQNFPYYQVPGKIPFIRTSMESSVHHPDSPSVNSSPFAANPLKLPGNYGENSTVNYLHENPVKTTTVSTLYDMSVIAPVYASYVPFIRALYI